MKSFLTAASLAALACAGSVAAQQQPGQTQAEPSASAGQSRLNMPGDSGFAPYAGIGVGRTKLHAPCPAGANCELRDNAWRVYGGGKLNNIVGVEGGLMDLGEYSRGGGSTTARGVDAKLTAGVPIGGNASVFGKLGLAYVSTNVSGAGLTEGKNDKWGPTYGIGAQVGLGKNWAIRGDIDRYRVQLPGTKDNIDTYMIGAQYTFR